MSKTPPPYYPVFLDLRGKRCVVVGGGSIAVRKVEGLREAEAVVTVVAPEIGEMPPDVECISRAFQPADLDDATLVFAATDDPEVNALVASEANARRILVNVVDDPEHCSCILPAVVRRGALRIAVSTAGASPALARKLRQELEATYGPEYGELVELLWRLRREWEPQAQAAGVPFPQRKNAWQAILRLPLLDALRNGEVARAEIMAREILSMTLTNY